MNITKEINNKDKKINNKRSFMKQTTIGLLRILTLSNIFALIFFSSKKTRRHFDYKLKRKLGDMEDDDYQFKTTNNDCIIEYENEDDQSHFTCDCCNYKIFKNNIDFTCICSEIPDCSDIDTFENFENDNNICTCRVNKNDAHCFNENLTLTYQIKCTCNFNFNCSGPDFLNKSCNPNIINDQQSALYIFQILGQINNGSFKEIFEDVIETGENYININNNITYQISTVSSQTPNLSIVYLEYCESILKRDYSLNESEKLVLFKLEHEIENFYIPIIEYQLFSKEGQILNLSSCEQNQVTITIPVSINEKKKFIHDPKDSFYKDKCLPYTSDGGSDVTHYDRKYDFNEKNLSLCEKNCEYKEYNDINKTATSICPIKIEFPKLTTEPLKFKDLLYRFVDFKKLFTNFCINLLQRTILLKRIKKKLW